MNAHGTVVQMIDCIQRREHWQQREAPAFTPCRNEKRLVADARQPTRIESAGLVSLRLQGEPRGFLVEYRRRSASPRSCVGLYGGHRGVPSRLCTAKPHLPSRSRLTAFFPVISSSQSQ